MTQQLGTPTDCLTNGLFYDGMAAFLLIDSRPDWKNGLKVTVTGQEKQST
jgi:hypothetical protein